MRRHQLRERGFRMTAEDKVEPVVEKVAPKKVAKKKTGMVKRAVKKVMGKK